LQSHNYYSTSSAPSSKPSNPNYSHNDHHTLQNLKNLHTTKPDRNSDKTSTTTTTTTKNYNLRKRRDAKTSIPVPFSSLLHFNFFFFSVQQTHRISKTATKPAFSRQQHKTKDKTKNYKKEPKETTRMPMANHG
jgi:hypothetical protein